MTKARTLHKRQDGITVGLCMCMCIYVFIRVYIYNNIYTYIVAIKNEVGHEDMPFPDIFESKKNDVK